MRKKRCSNHKKLNVRLAVAIFAAAALLLCAELSVRPVAAETAAYSAKLSAATMLNDAVLDEFQEYREEFADLVHVEYGDGGAITSISTDALAAGIFKERIIKRLTRELARPVTSDTGIPIGSLTGLSLFAGYGPELPLRYTMVGAPTASLKSYFVSGGINQSVHRIVVCFSVEVRSVLPVVSGPEIVNGEVLVSETVIVGEVPDTYWGR